MKTLKVDTISTIFETIKTLCQYNKNRKSNGKTVEYDTV